MFPTQFRFHINSCFVPNFAHNAKKNHQGHSDKNSLKAGSIIIGYTAQANLKLIQDNRKIRQVTGCMVHASHFGFFSSLYLDFSHHWQLEWYPARVNYFESPTALGLFNTIFKMIEFFIRLLHSKSTKISKLYII